MSYRYIAALLPHSENDETFYVRDKSVNTKQNICITFIQCWTNVEDVGPTLYKCYTNVFCLLGNQPTKSQCRQIILCYYEFLFIHTVLFDYSRHNPVSTKHLYNICTMLDQRRRRWAYVVQMLYKCFVFAGKAMTFSFLIMINV